MASGISMKALLESGVHFGHRTNKWDPKMRPFIFTERNGIHIIDLQQTVKCLSDAYDLIRDTVAAGGKVMFVGTKRQAQDTIREEAMRCGMPYVTTRWLGGTLTNWVTIQKRIYELERLEKLRDTGEINRLTKKEGLLIAREIRRLELRLSGLRNMQDLPDLIFIVDVGREYTAVHESNVKKIPIIAMVDTNCDPRNIDYVIPSNDDAIRAIKLVVSKIADAALEGKAIRKDEDPEAHDLSAAQIPVVAENQFSAIEVEQELDDAALLGQATLAKLSTQVEETKEAEVEAAPVVETEEVVEPVEETKSAE
jgi:small subunit ribosomal protein S2